jgi:hypothetical protein
MGSQDSAVDAPFVIEEEREELGEAVSDRG